MTIGYSIKTDTILSLKDKNRKRDKFHYISLVL